MLTAAEQHLLELVNRARLDPLGEAARYEIDLNDGLDPGTLDGAPRQPLAPNPMLTAAARDHGDWLIANDAFSHSGVAGTSPFDRITEAGYDFWTAGENLALYRVLPGPIDGDGIMAEHHRGLFLSPGHRSNMLAEPFREAGIGQSVGPWQLDDATWSASIAVEKFGAASGGFFLTGVAFADGDEDGAYSVGEGRGGVAFAALGETGRSADGAGGYALAIGAAQGWAEVTMGGAAARLRLSGENAKLDHVETGSGAVEIRASTDLELISGAAQARLLGAGDLSLAGSEAGERLVGNRGANDISGGAGHDTLEGGAGGDALVGGAGHDSLVGGAGADDLRGGAGRDRLEGGDGADALRGGGWADRLAGEAGADTLWGGAGPDRLGGGGGDDRIVGGAHADRLWGGDGADTLTGAAGRDSLSGGRDDDLLHGGRHHDRLAGQGGADTLEGGWGHDTLEGGWGPDRLAGQGGDDLLSGGAGADSFVFAGRWGGDRIADFDPAVDLLILAPGQGEAESPAAFRAALTGTAEGALYDLGADGQNTILFAGLDPESLSALALLVE